MQAKQKRKLIHELAFYDSNILLDAYSKTTSETHKRDIARQLLLASNWCISAQVLQEFYSNAIRARAGQIVMLNSAEAQMVVSNIASKVLCAVDEPLVQQAIRISQRHQLSYWDGAIVAAAVRCGADELVSEDLNAGQVIEGMEVVNPFGLCHVA
ncbi:MAG: PIN domain-containing protein [Brachymonas sp.]|nr:PIN domain-containing protein [Brachymonas sp.]